MHPLIKSKIGIIFLAIFCLFAQNIFAQIKGKVLTAESQQPVVGSTVEVKGTTKKTVTDEAGAFIINASKEDILVVSSIGYVLQEVKARQY